MFVTEYLKDYELQTEHTHASTCARYTYMGVEGVQPSTIPCVTMVNETTHSTMERNIKKRRKKLPIPFFQFNLW